MTAKTLALAGAAALALLAASGATQAQTTRGGGGDAGPAAPPAPALNYGPPIAGVCVISTQETLGRSAVGKSVSDRMNQLRQQVATELQPQATELATEQRALQAAAAPDPARINAFDEKASAYQKLHDQRIQELDATEQKQVRRMLLELQPVLQQMFQQKQCTILIERDNNVLAVNPAMDLTDSAVVGLNGRLQTLTFDREPLPAQGAPGAQ